MQSFALVVSASLCQVFVKFLLADWKSFVDVSLQLGVSSLVVKVSKFLGSDYASLECVGPPWKGLLVFPKCATLLRVQSLTTPIHGDFRCVTPGCNFTSCSCIRPRQSMGRVARHADKVSFYDAFARSTTPIHGKGCIGCIPDGGVGAGCGFRKNI